MVTTKHCCYGHCKSDSRRLADDSGVYFIGLGNGFPKPSKEVEKCKRWVQNCGRKFFDINSVKKDTYICSLHFVGGNGPTEEHPDPIKCRTQIVRARKGPQVRGAYKSPKRRRLKQVEAADILLKLQKGVSLTNQVKVKEEEMPSTSGVLQNSCTTKDVGVLCRPILHDKDTQTFSNSSYVNEVIKLRIQNRLLRNDLQRIRCSIFFKEPSVKSETEC